MLLGTDGLYDNLFDDQLVAQVQSFLGGMRNEVSEGLTEGACKNPQEADDADRKDRVSLPPISNKYMFPSSIQSIPYSHTSPHLKLHLPPNPP